MTMPIANSQSILWFHSFEFPNGQRVDGIKPYDILKAEADVIFCDDLAGKTVLDIGAWDGFFSFEAERRGAARVVATDHFCWSGPGWGTRDGFNYAYGMMQSGIEAVDVDLPHIAGVGLGQFDTVLFLGVFYHLKDPYVGLEIASSMCRDHLVMETVTALPRETQPAMRLLTPGELDGDDTNFWVPNIPALELMLKTFGFKTVRAMPSPTSSNHPITAGRLSPPRRTAVHRTIVHAWRDAK